MASLRKFHLVLAASLPEYGIGVNGQLPWRLPEDMKHFKQITTDTSDSTKQNAVIMGRKTWESIPSKFRPLPNRLNVILTRNLKSEKAIEIDKCENTLVVSSFEHALECLSWPPYATSIESIYVIGGSQVYNEAISQDFMPYVQSIYLTKIFKSFPNCDTHFKIDTSMYNEMNLSQRHQSQSNKELEYQLVQLLPKSSMVNVNNNNNNEENNKVNSNVNGNVSANANNKENNSSMVNKNNNNNNNNSNDKTDDKSDQKTQDPSVAPSDTTTTTNVSEPQTQASIPVTATMFSPNFGTNFTNNNGMMHEEYQYLQLIEHIINHGITRGDRTGTGTKSIFGATMRFNLRNNQFPLLTTKRVFWRGVCKELLWFIQGCTDAKELQKQNIHIWDGNGSREFLDSVGLNKNEIGDLGPVYGFQWRHFGAEYDTCHSNYNNKGIDQLLNVINMIKTNPNSRRIVLTAWNPSDLNKMALPPCHMFCQFYVANNELSCQMYQRSADMGLGVPFNIASYSLLTRMIAQVCKLQCGDFIHVIGDCHVYLNHIEPLKEQLKRKPKSFPILKMNPNKLDIDKFVYDDFKIVGYSPHKTIKMKMAV